MDDAEDLQKELLIWALGGFQPTGPQGFKPDAPVDGKEDESHPGKSPKAKKKLFMETKSTPNTPGSNIPGNELEDVAFSLNKLSCKSREETPCEEKEGKTLGKETTSKKEERSERRGTQRNVGWQKLKKKRGRRKAKRGLNDESDPEESPCLPQVRKKIIPRAYYNMNTETTSTYTQPDQQARGNKQNLITETQEFTSCHVNFDSSHF